MSEMKELFRPFIATDAKANWDNYTSPRMEYGAGAYPGFDFEVGLLVATKEGYMDIPHIHDGADNYFVFAGADLDDIFNSEFEVDIFLGDSPTAMEMYKITKPSIVRIPAGVWHCPVYYKNIVRGLTTIMWYSGQSTGRVYPVTLPDGSSDIRYEKDNWVQPCVKDPEKLCTYCGACFSQSKEHVDAFMKPFIENAVPTRKYQDCIVELRADRHNLGDAIKNPRLVFAGASELKMVDRQFSINIIDKPCVLGDAEPISNGQITEYLWFSGSDAYDPWNSFDAEIEVMLGSSPDKMEKVSFDKPGVVVVPPGVWRGEVTVKRAGKPLCFMPWYPHTDKRYKLTQKIVDGKAVRVYDDESTITEPSAGDELYLQIKR